MVFRFLASGGYDASICIWDLPSATPLAAVYTPDDAVRAMSFSSDHCLLAYSSQSAEGQQGSVDVVAVQSGERGVGSLRCGCDICTHVLCIAETFCC